MAGLVWSAIAAVGAPVMPTRVPYDQLAVEPYRHAGLVRTESNGADPTVLGSGWVAGERVVASAAHVFFVEETLGWNRNRWYWRRAAPAGSYWYTSDMQVPRSYRVLAGYTMAAQRSRSNPLNHLDTLNRDAIALLFYRAATDAPPPARLTDALAGSGTYSIIGYPGSLNRVRVPEIEMYAHLGGEAATYTLNGSENDYLGRPNVLYQTSNISTGPGASGGPVFKLSNGTWSVVGTLLAGMEFTSSTARAVDADLESMLAGAIADSTIKGPGELLWEITEPGYAAPVMRSDGSTVMHVHPNAVRAFDTNGAEIWNRELPSSSVSWMAETPDGRIVIGDLYTIIALEGSTGRQLWRSAVESPCEGGAVGEIGEVYVSRDRYVARVSSKGTRNWSVWLPDDQVHSGAQTPPAVASDGTVYVLAQDRLYALNPADGSVKWRSVMMPGMTQDSLSLGTDGSITLTSRTAISRFESDGSLRWLHAVPGPHVPRGIVRGDGSVVMVNSTRDGLLFLKPDGSTDKTMPVTSSARSVVEDQAGNVYVGGDTWIEAYSSSGPRLWENTAVGGEVQLGPGNYLVVFGGAPNRKTAIGSYAGVAPDLWQTGVGGAHAARRVANSLPVVPRIVTPPTPARVVTGYRLVLEVEAEGSFPMTFEWRRDGVLVPDQFGQRMIISATTSEDAGDYTVTVRNRAGAVESDPVTVTVGAARFGDTLWTTTLQTEIAPAVADDGTVYVLASEPDPNDQWTKITRLVALSAGGVEKWRVELHRGDTSIWASPPIVGDDGRIYVATPGKIRAISSAGTELWRHEYSVTSSSSWAVLSLAADNGLFYNVERRLGRLSATGTHLWERADLNISGTYVRHDGSMVAGVGAVVTPEGVVRSTIVAVNQPNQGFPGPNDEWILTSTYDGGVTLDRDGVVVARNPDSFGDLPQFMLGDGTIISDRLRSEPFMGTGSQWLPNPNNSMPVAILEGDRILCLSDSYKTTVINRSGDVLAESTNIKGHRLTVGPQGVLVGGSPVVAYHLDWPAANTPWPLIRADSRQTNRAPAQFHLAPLPPASVEIRGRIDPTDRYDRWIQYHTATMTAYSGYSARLNTTINGTGPFSIRWKKDGQELAAVPGGELAFATLQASDSGNYTVSVTNAAGTSHSESFTLVVSPPVSVPPGNHVHMWKDPGSGTAFPCLLVVRPDRTVVMQLFNTFGFEGRGKLNPDGSFRVATNGGEMTGTYDGNNFAIGGTTLDAVPVPVTGHAPNGLPAGVYRGHLLGATGFPVTMVVFADGTFSWLQTTHNGYSRVGSGAFPASGLTCTFTYTSMATVTYTLSARTDGAVVGTLEGGTSDGTGFVAVWSGRPEVERLVNLSTRGYVTPSQPPMVAGFVVDGTTEHGFLLRAAGPALHDLGVQETLAQPRLFLMNSSGQEIRRSAAWGLDPSAGDIRTAANRLGAFPFKDDSRDTALVTRVQPGLFTALVEAVDGGSGVALVEVYEDAATSGGGSRLRNLSTRGLVGAGERVLVGGFVVNGVVPKSMLIRAVGPSLAPLINGAFNVAPDPRIQLYRQNVPQPIASNDNVWGGSNPAEVHDAARRVGAFPLISSSFDAAMVVALEPGIYTVVVDNVTAAEGIALLEIYEVPVQ